MADSRMSMERTVKGAIFFLWHKISLALALHYVVKADICPKVLTNLEQTVFTSMLPNLIFLAAPLDLPHELVVLMKALSCSGILHRRKVQSLTKTGLLHLQRSLADCS